MNHVIVQIPQEELFSTSTKKVFTALCDMLAYNDLLADVDNTSDLHRILEKNVQSACQWVGQHAFSGMKESIGV